MASKRLRSFVPMLAILIAPAAAAAQSMSYSVYTDAWAGSDAWTVYGYSELDDFSGCGSMSLQSTEIYTPTRWTSASGSTAALSFDDDEGDWTVLGRFQISCNCAPYGGNHNYTMTGGGPKKKVTKFAARFIKQGPHPAGRTKYVAQNCSHKCQIDKTCPDWDPDASPTYAVAHGLYIDPPGGCTGLLHGTFINPTGSCYGPSGPPSIALTYAPYCPEQ